MYTMETQEQTRHSFSSSLSRQQTIETEETACARFYSLDVNWQRSETNGFLVAINTKQKLTN